MVAVCRYDKWPPMIDFVTLQRAAKDKYINPTETTVQGFPFTASTVCRRFNLDGRGTVAIRHFNIIIIIIKFSLITLNQVFSTTRYRGFPHLSQIT